MEIWKDIEGFENYQVSNEGRVKSLERRVNFKNTTRLVKEKILKLANNGSGYLFVQLWKNKKPTNKLIHRLVAEVFIDNPTNLPQVNHKDENKHNNKVENLEWCSSKYNMNYGTAISRRIEKQSVQVDQFDAITGEFIRRWSSTNECGRNGYSQSTVSQCCNGLRKQHKGYRWSFVPL